MEADFRATFKRDVLYQYRLDCCIKYYSLEKFLNIHSMVGSTLYR